MHKHATPLCAQQRSVLCATSQQQQGCVAQQGWYLLSRVSNQHF